MRSQRSAGRVAPVRAAQPSSAADAPRPRVTSAAARAGLASLDLDAARIAQRKTEWVQRVEASAKLCGRSVPTSILDELKVDVRGSSYVFSAGELGPVRGLDNAVEMLIDACLEHLAGDVEARLECIPAPQAAAAGNAHGPSEGEGAQAESAGAADATEDSSALTAALENAQTQASQAKADAAAAAAAAEEAQARARGAEVCIQAITQELERVRVEVQEERDAKNKLQVELEERRAAYDSLLTELCGLTAQRVVLLENLRQEENRANELNVAKMEVEHKARSDQRVAALALDQAQREVVALQEQLCALRTAKQNLERDLAAANAVKPTFMQPVQPAFAAAPPQPTVLAQVGAWSVVTSPAAGCAAPGAYSNTLFGSVAAPVFAPPPPPPPPPPALPAPPPAPVTARHAASPRSYVIPAVFDMFTGKRVSVRLAVYDCLTTISRMAPDVSSMDFATRRSWIQVKTALGKALGRPPGFGGVHCSAFTVMEHAHDSQSMHAVQRTMEESDHEACEVMLSAAAPLSSASMASGATTALYKRFIFVPHFLSKEMIAALFGNYGREPKDRHGNVTPALLVVCGTLDAVNGL